LGGIYTALFTTRADVVIFLACDMPFVSISWLRKLMRGLRKGDRAVFTYSNDRVGFPFILRRGESKVVKRQIDLGVYSLQELARETNARSMRQPPSMRFEAFNVNAPEDWLKAVARVRFAATGHGSKL
jgi:molybdopterin-guanine dinucleotide biosynthesis protein A